MRTTTGLLLRAVAIAGFVSICSPIAFGQESEIEKAKRAELERRAGENERRLATWELRMAEIRRPPARERNPSLAYSQIREDYKQIQIANNDLARQVSSTNTLDFNYIEKSVSEIKKRAARLKENMVLPESKETSHPNGSEIRDGIGPLKSALVVLDNLVMEFINSPIFEQTKTVDIPTAAKARRTLEAILGISEQIKKSSEKLRKLAPKAQ